tara:strand:- start:106 stop:669 length:564 start_codon:yes stop_codon:yes gene_type:complete
MSKPDRRGLHLAGRWLQKAANNPITSSLGLGAATAGTATLGNIFSGEAGREGGGRLALEALGAGALGGALGAYLPQARKNVLATLKERGQPGSTTKVYAYDPKSGQSSGYWEQEIEELLKKSGIKNSNIYGSAIESAVLGGGLTAGAVGGQIGGGVSNIGNMAGLPGLQQNTIVDPEAYGSSNLRVY